MKFDKVFLSSFLVLFVLISASLPVQAAGTVSVIPPSTVNAGDIFTVEIRAAADKFAGAGFVLTYDGKVLSASKVETGSMLSGAGSYLESPGNSIDNKNGKIKYTVSLTGGATASGSGGIAKVTFTALSAGTSALSLSGTDAAPYVLVDANGDPLSGVTITGASIDVKASATPTPNITATATPNVTPTLTPTITPTSTPIVPTGGNVSVSVPSTAKAGETFTVPITATANNFSGVGFTLTYDKSIIKASKVDIGGFLSSAGTVLESPGNRIDNATGALQYTVSLTGGKTVSGSGTIATVAFTALSAGTSTLDLSGTTAAPNILVDADGNPFTGVTINDGSVKVEAAAIIKTATSVTVSSKIVKKGGTVTLEMQMSLLNATKGISADNRDISWYIDSTYKGSSKTSTIKGVSGSATYQLASSDTSALTTGSHIIKAEFKGDDDLYASSGTNTLTVLPSVGIPSDTTCTAGWPSHQGGTIKLNDNNYACDLFEVTNSGLLALAQEAEDSCLNACSNSGAHGYCTSIYTMSGLSSGVTAEKFKKCVALYEIYALGPAAKYMKDYFYPEICCGGDCPAYGDCASSDNGKCSCQGRTYGSKAKSIPCQGNVGQPSGWASDTDMSKNSCVFSDIPAHASANIISTGTCVDYSVVVTTLLRMSGYSKTEAYSMTGPGHEYNVVKFPGDAKYTIIDTVGNYPTPYRPSNTPGTWFQYCSYLSGTSTYTACSNDAGPTSCPAKSEIYGCT